MLLSCVTNDRNFILKTNFDLISMQWDGGGGHWLVRMEWRPAGWSMCLPVLIFPFTINPEVLFWHRLIRMIPEKGP